MEQIPEDVDPPERDGDGAAFVMTDPSVLAGGPTSDAPPAAGTSPAVVDAEPDPETITGAGMVPPRPGPDDEAPSTT